MSLIPMVLSTVNRLLPAMGCELEVVMHCLTVLYMYVVASTHCWLSSSLLLISMVIWDRCRHLPSLYRVAIPAYKNTRTHTRAHTARLFSQSLHDDMHIRIYIYICTTDKNEYWAAAGKYHLFRLFLVNCSQHFVKPTIIVYLWKRQQWKPKTRQKNIYRYIYIKKKPGLGRKVGRGRRRRTNCNPSLYAARISSMLTISETHEFARGCLSPRANSSWSPAVWSLQYVRRDRVHDMCRKWVKWVLSEETRVLRTLKLMCWSNEMQKVRRKRGRKHAFDFLGDSEAKRSEIRLHDVRGCATVELVHNGRYETQKSKQEWSITGESSEKRYTLSIPGVFESL